MTKITKKATKEGNHQKDDKEGKHKIVTHLQILNSIASMGENIGKSLDTTEVNANKQRQKEVNRINKLKLRK